MQCGQLSLTVPEDIYVNREKQQLLLETVKGLKEDEQQIIMMRCFSDTPFKDIAAAMGCSESTIKTKFYRSLNKLESAIYDIEKKRESDFILSVSYRFYFFYLYNIRRQCLLIQISRHR